VVFGERPIRVELKLPVPVPSLVFVVKEIVGLVLVDHTTPLAVMGALPSDVMFPPDLAEMEVISVP
jgi:hypothetical protein